MMRVFVGTLSCGEGELEQCKAAVLGQQDVRVTHCVISDLPEREAHDSLWREWEAAREHHDLFVKVDADTVLVNPWVLARIAETFGANSPHLTGMQLPILDYFTDGPIAGLNAFSPKVRFQRSPELHCDRADSGHVMVLKCQSDDMTHDAFTARAAAMGLWLPLGGPIPIPAAKHCFSPTDAQAFHFGLHRALKGQEGVLAKVRSAYRRDLDRPRAFALAGAADAHRAPPGGQDYGSAWFKEALRNAQESLR